MKILFVGSKNGKEKIPEVYQTVISNLRKQKIEILGPYVQKYEEVLTAKEINSVKGPVELHALFMRKVIGLCDLMIMEITFDGFALGHEATVALEQNKPVLAIAQKEFDFAFIFDKRFFFKIYKSPDELPKVISDFVALYNSRFRSIRVNFLINQRHENYLNWNLTKRGVNKSSLVRELLDEKMKHDDEYLDILKRIDF